MSGAQERRRRRPGDITRVSAKSGPGGPDEDERAREKVDRALRDSSGSAAVAELVAAGREAAAGLQLDEAVTCFRKAVQLDRDNSGLLDALGELLLDKGDLPEALAVFQQSVAMAPEDNYAKYMHLAQLFEGKDSLACIHKAISLLQAELERSPSEQLVKQVASAYCSIAEMFMTDLCFEEDAEQQCEAALAAAMQRDPGSWEALQTLASVRISQCRPDEAKELVAQSVTMWYVPRDEDDRPEEERNLPPLLFRVSTAKLLLELELFPQAVEILEDMVEEEDADPEIWYLMSLAYKFSDDGPSAAQCVVRALELIKKEPADEVDQEFVQELEMMLQELPDPDAAMDDDDDDDDDDAQGRGNA